MRRALTWTCASLALACHSPSSGTEAGTASATTSVAASGSGAATATTGSATVGSHVDGNHFTVDVATPAACAPDTECTIAARVTALGDYHVNKEYPYKLKMEDAAGVTFLGKDPQGASTFSKAAGDFALAGEKEAVMTVRYRAAPGTHPVAGTLKLSVCTAAACLLEQAKVTATVAAR